MDLENIRNNRRKIILQFAIPSIISMVLTSMINIVDGFFTGNYIGSNGLAAINLGLPIVYLYLAVGLMFSVGGVSIAGRLLGAKDIKNTNNIFRQTMITTAIVSILLTIALFFLLKPVGNILHPDRQTLEYFYQYYGVLIYELPLMIIVSSFGMFIRGEGNPVFVMLTNIINVLLNIIFDYIAVRSLHLGITGIAWASFFSTAIVLLLNLFYFIKWSKVYKLGFCTFSAKGLTETILNGSSEFIGEMTMCFSMAAYNYIILRYIGTDGVAAFTIVGYVSYVFSMVIVGFGQGIVPLVSFTYGANDPHLSIRIRNTTNIMVSTAAVFVFVLMCILSDWYCKIFAQDQQIISMVSSGLKIQMLSFAFAGINTITSFYFTAIGKAMESAVISFARGFLILMIFIFTLPVWFGITGVWFVSLATETVTILLSILFIWKEHKQYRTTSIA